MDEFNESCTDDECLAEFGRLFPDGFSGPDVTTEIELEKIGEIAGDDPGETARNIGELVGRCVWDVFSDQHDVIAADGRVIHLGSFRGTGEFLAEYLNSRTGRREYDYMSFYLGTAAPWAERDGDLMPVYELIFRRLKNRNLDWVYHFPGVYVVDFRARRESLDREGNPDWLDYSPAEVLANEEEDRRRDQEIAQLRDQLEEGRNDAIEEALKRPPPAIVRSYRTVYGRWRRGWPPTPGGE